MIYVLKTNVFYECLLSAVVTAALVLAPVIARNGFGISVFGIHIASAVGRVIFLVFWYIVFLYVALLVALEACLILGLWRGREMLVSTVDPSADVVAFVANETGGAIRVLVKWGEAPQFPLGSCKVRLAKLIAERDGKQIWAQSPNRRLLAQGKHEINFYSRGPGTFGICVESAEDHSE